MRDYNPSDFIIRYPGVYDEKEQAGLEIFWKEADAINHRGPIDVKAMIEGRLAEVAKMINLDVPEYAESEHLVP